jgi:ribosomal protein S12 methylthiotransferase
MVTLGCPKNRVDSEMMGELLRQAGHRAASSARQADVVVVNTCGFIEPAREESYRTLRELAAKKGRRQWLIAAGCMAQRYGEEIRRQVPEVDAVIGTQSWPKIVTLLSQMSDRTEDSPAPTIVEWDGNPVASIRRRAASGASAYVKITDGCDAACAFCAIPLIKGPQRSKPAEDILREIREVAAQGVREVVLIGQDSTAYGRDLGMGDGLPTLVRSILDAAPGVDWLRLMYAYPQHVSPQLIEVMATSPALCHYLDLPLQHGHPDVLRRMRRPHDVDQVVQLADALRVAMPDIALRSTFIVGFPGESEQEFEGLLAFMQRIAFDQVGVFAYSREEGTPAADYPDQVDAATIAERYDRAMLCQQAISLNRNRAQIGRQLPILVEGSGGGLVVGRSYREAPEVDGMVLLAGEATPGEFLACRIVGAQEYDLIAERVEPASATLRVP